MREQLPKLALASNLDKVKGNNVSGPQNMRLEPTLAFVDCYTMSIIPCKA